MERWSYGSKLGLRVPRLHKRFFIGFQMTETALAAKSQTTSPPAGAPDSQVHLPRENPFGQNLLVPDPNGQDRFHSELRAYTPTLKTRAVTAMSEALEPMLGVSETKAKQRIVEAGYAPDTPLQKYLEEHPLERLRMRGFLGALWDAATTPIVQVPRVNTGQVQAQVPGVSTSTAGVIAGSEQAAAGIAESFASPLGVATLGIGALPRLGQRLVAGAFGAHMAIRTPEAARRLGNEMGKGNTEGAVREGLNLAAQVGFGAAGLTHAARPAAPATPSAHPQERVPLETAATPTPAIPAPATPVLAPLEIGQKLQSLVPGRDVTLVAGYDIRPQRGRVLEHGQRIDLDSALKPEHNSFTEIFLETVSGNTYRLSKGPQEGSYVLYDMRSGVTRTIGHQRVRSHELTQGQPFTWAENGLEFSTSAIQQITAVYPYQAGRALGPASGQSYVANKMLEAELHRRQVFSPHTMDPLQVERVSFGSMIHDGSTHYLARTLDGTLHYVFPKEGRIYTQHGRSGAVSELPRVQQNGTARYAPIEQGQGAEALGLEVTEIFQIRADGQVLSHGASRALKEFLGGLPAEESVRKSAVTRPQETTPQLQRPLPANDTFVDVGEMMRNPGVQYIVRTEKAGVQTIYSLFQDNGTIFASAGNGSPKYAIHPNTRIQAGQNLRDGVTVKEVLRVPLYDNCPPRALELMRQQLQQGGVQTH